MSSISNSISPGLANFFTWWGSELVGLLPRAFIRGTQIAPPNRIISVEDGHLRLIAANGVMSDDLLATADVVNRLAAAKNRATLRVGLRVPYRACFSRRVELPSAAVRDFPRLLALDLERATPFKPRDVRTSHYIEEEQRTSGKTALRQLVLKRTSVDGVISALRDAGIAVTQIDCWAPDGQGVMPVNFLDAPSDASTPRQGWFGPVALTASAAALAAFGGYTLLDRHATALANLSTETAKLRLLVQQNRNLETEFRARQAEAGNFGKVLMSAPSKAQALEELTRLLPDNARLTDLRFDGTSVHLTGVAQSAIGLMPLLERSTVFVNAEQREAIMADQREGKERFSIQVQIRSAVADPAKPDAAKLPGGVQ
jgi:general secretion pathway protein L